MTTTTATRSYTSRLHGLLLQYYDAGDLRTLCLLVDVNYNLLIGEHMGQKATSLLETLVREARLEELIGVCKEKFPIEQWDKSAEELALEQERATRRAALAAEIGPETPHSTLTMTFTPGAEGQSVERGLAALTDLMSAPEARTAVIAFRTDFEAIASQIDILADYKQLHDLLHVLETQCFNTMQQASKLFPDDETAVDTIMDAELTLQQTVDAFKLLAARPSFAATELAWVQDLGRAQTTLTEALDGQDAEKLRRTLWLINRVVAIQPSQINTRLNAFARTLRLASLVTAMTGIHENIAKLAMDETRLQEFIQGAYGLSRLNNTLGQLIEAHDAWQSIMLELRRVGLSLDQDPLEMEMSWPDLRPLLEARYTPHPDQEWATALQEDCDRLGEAIAGGNPVRVNRFFRRLEQRARNRFYVVDVDLRRLCEDLRRVGQPLAAVLKLLE